MSEEEKDEARDRLKSKLPWLVQLAIHTLGHWFKGLKGNEKMDVLARLLDYLVRFQALDGYRTYLGGWGFILTGIGIILTFAGDPDHTAVGILAGMASISNGIKIIGQRAAQQRQIDTTVKENGHGDAG